MSDMGTSELVEIVQREFAARQALQRESDARKEDARVVAGAREDWSRQAYAVARDVDSLSTAITALVADAEAAARLGATLDAEHVRVRVLHLRSLLQPIGGGVTRLACDVAPVRSGDVLRRFA